MSTVRVGLVSGLPRDGREGTYAIVSIDDGVITDVAFHQIER